MGKTWKDKQKWEKKHTDKPIKKTKKEKEQFDNSKKPRISHFNWYDADYE